MRLILIRHGETPWNEAGRYQGWEDVPLSPRGCMTARRVGVLLRNHGVSRCLAWSSDLKRAEWTARIALRRAPRTDVRLRELHFGAFAGFTYDENLERHRSRFVAWMDGGGDPPPPGGESLTAFHYRTRAWLRSVRAGPARQDTVVAFTHGGVVRALAQAVGVELDGVEPGSITELRWTHDEPHPSVERWVHRPEAP